LTNAPSRDCCTSFYTFPDHIEKTTFGVSCDAFANFKVRGALLLLRLSRFAARRCSGGAQADVLSLLWRRAQETLTKHKPMVAEYLEKNYDKVSGRVQWQAGGEGEGAVGRGPEEGGWMRARGKR
jgi:hypothetical protein